MFTLKDKPGSASWRMDIWSDTITMIKERPFFGHGPNTYMRIFQEYNRDAKFSPTYTHNSFLQLTAEIGLLGLLCFLWIIILVFSQTLKSFGQFNSHDVILMAGMLAGLVSFFVHSVFDNNFYSLKLSSYLWVMIGITMSFYKICLNES